MATDFQTGGQSTVCSAAEGHHLLDLATRGNEQSRQGGKVGRHGPEGAVDGQISLSRIPSR